MDGLSARRSYCRGRKRICDPEAGTLPGPTIYTSGPFVNEPRVNTPEEVERDIIAQQQLGYDLIKFHEFIRTTTGLSRPAYRRMIETSRRTGIPLIGHAPINLGIDEMLQARQSIAHLGLLDNIYFLPFSSHTTVLVVTAVAALILMDSTRFSFFVTPRLPWPGRCRHCWLWSAQLCPLRFLEGPRSSGRSQRVNELICCLSEAIHWNTWSR